VSNSAANDLKSKRANAVELEQEPSTWGFSRRGVVRGCVSVPVEEGKSQNPTVAVHISGIPISQYLDMQADIMVVIEKHYGKLRASFSLQHTSVTIRSYSCEGKGW